MDVKINRNLTTVNYTHANNTSKVWAGQKRSIEWIVLHYTANGKSYKGMAYNNTAYFKSVYRGCSAHYFVDDAEIWQSVEDRDSSWHCGDAASRNGCHNWNSIGIEICDNNGEITPAAEALAVQLVKLKMKQYNIPITRVCRHYDVTGKKCPASWANDETKWRAFLSKLSDTPKPQPAQNPNLKTVGRRYNGINIGRNTDYLVVYKNKTSTGTNQWGYEVPLDKNGIALSDPVYKGDTPIPAGGCVISAHGNAANWLHDNIRKGYFVSVNADGNIYVDKWQHRSVDGVNVGRGKAQLIVYRNKATTGTNSYGYEVAIDKNGYAVSNPAYKGNTAIPEGGFVLSGHLSGKGESAGHWIYENIKKGTHVKFDGKVISIV